MTSELVAQIHAEVSRQECFVALNSRCVVDDDLGGEVLEVTCTVCCPRQEFKRFRSDVIEAYQRATIDLDTRFVVFLVQRAKDT